MEAEQKEKEEKEKKEAERKAKYDKWGKGLVQTANQRTNVEEAMHEMSKSLTRHRDDEDLDAMLKDRVREEDPMLAFIGKKNIKGKGNVGQLNDFRWFMISSHSLFSRPCLSLSLLLTLCLSPEPMLLIANFFQ